MDFVTGIPLTTRGHDCILVIIDRLTKYAFFIPCNKKVSAKDVAQIYYDTVLLHQGLPESIISDRDSKFLSQFWTHLFKIFQTSLKFSTSFHPQSDGQTEKTNDTMQRILKKYVHPHQHDWDLCLTSAAIAYNNAVCPTTGYSPYHFHLGRQLRLPMDFLLPSQRSPSTPVPSLNEWIRQMDDQIRLATQSLEAAQATQQREANKHRSDVLFDIGDEVLVSTEHFQPEEGCTKKLSPKYLGPFKVIQKIHENCYKLALPPDMKCHPVFNVVYLRRHNPNLPQFQGRPSPSPPPVLTPEGVPEYVVEAIIGRRATESKTGKKPSLEYHVRWQGYPLEDATWEPLAHLSNAKRLTRAYDRFLKKKH
jgi:hypothetical protein